MLGTPREDEHRADLWNYFYRGILAFGFAAMAFGDRALLDRIRKYRDQFERHPPKHGAYTSPGEA